MKRNGKPGAAFGRPEVFVERYIKRAKHIEVQVLGDKHGNLVHLHASAIVRCSGGIRRWSRLRRASNLPIELRRRIVRSSGEALPNAMDYDNRWHGRVPRRHRSARSWYFIEMNPRIQVEHTVTEEVTGIDLVRQQMLIAQGRRLHRRRCRIPAQDDIRTQRLAMQCRITTEDPENKFIPDYGRITTYRSAGGFGVRLDGGNGFAGAVVTPFYDSLLVKITACGRRFDEALQRMDRALREFRIRGVKTNIPFLGNLVLHPTFMSGTATTDSIDTTPELFRFRRRADRATKLLTYLGDVIVNGSSAVKGHSTAPGPFRTGARRRGRPQAPPPPGRVRSCSELGPKKFAAWVREQKRLLITDTTMRDAHQSLLATRVRTYDMLAIADAVRSPHAQLVLPGNVGRCDFRHGDAVSAGRPVASTACSCASGCRTFCFRCCCARATPWAIQIIRTTWSRDSSREAARHGMDVFRVFDSLN